MFGNNTPLIQQRMKRDSDRAQFDAMSAKEAANSIEFDPIGERAATHATVQMRLAALQVTFLLASMLSESDVDDSDELMPNELLDQLTLSVFSNDDDDTDDDEVDDSTKAVLSAHISDAMSSLGVDDDLINDAFSTDFDVADAAIESAAETILENIPADGDELDAFISAFAYGQEDEEQMDGGIDQGEYDTNSAQFDAARKKLSAGKSSVKKVAGRTIRYKAVKAIRGGKKVVVNKRIGGKIKLSPKQKAALKKARVKATTGSSLRKRVKSFKKGMRMNLYKK